MNAALLRYRIMAYVVGVLLLILVFVAVPLERLAEPAHPLPAKIIGQLHGVLYIVYLVTAFQLAVKARFRLGTTVMMLLAGVVPFLSFVAERKVTGWVRQHSEPVGAST